MKQEKKAQFALSLLKNPEKEMSAASIARLIGVTSMGALKIARTLENERIISKRKIGHANIYNLNLDKKYTLNYLSLLLNQEAEFSIPEVKVIINDLEKISSPEVIILFGSVINKKEANDIDVLFIVEQKSFNLIKKEIEKFNSLSQKKIHALFQSKKDFVQNIKIKDKVVLNAIKGLIIKGENKFIELLR